MNELIRTFGDEKYVLLFTGFISVYMALVVLMITRIKSRHYRIRTEKEKAFELLLKGFNQKTLNANAIYLIYKREVARKFESVSYVGFLESFLIYVRKKDEDGILTKDVSGTIESILEKEQADKPYSNVKEREKRILCAIEESANKGENLAVKNNLKDLSIVIENNQKTLDRARLTNKWTIPISIIGILLTLFIWLYGSSLSDKDVQRISTQIYKSVVDSLHVDKSDSLTINK